jgi:hypothetical protein
MGWFLMLILAELIGIFGRVTSMATLAAFATRIVRYSASFYVLTVGLGQRAALQLMITARRYSMCCLDHIVVDLSHSTFIGSILTNR